MVYKHDIPRESPSSLLKAHIRHCLQVILRLTTDVDDSEIILVRLESLYCFYTQEALVTTEVVDVLAAPLLSKIRIASVQWRRQRGARGAVAPPNVEKDGPRISSKFDE